MVYRVFVEKLPEYACEAENLYNDLRSLLPPDTLTGLRIVNRYDVEGIDRALFDRAVQTVFSEPQTDRAYEALTIGDNETVFALEYLPGQFDQRADSAAQCIQMLSQGERPRVRTAKLYVLEGTLTDAQLRAVKAQLLNPVESREASLEPVDTLAVPFAPPAPIRTLTGFCALDRTALADFGKRYGLAMDTDDLAFCQSYFRSEKRDPTLTEIRVIDTYWSDHCRHTTFLTVIDDVTFEDVRIQKTFEEYLAERTRLGIKKPCCLMDLATVGAKSLKAQGLLDRLDESEEINACTVKTQVTVDDEKQDWLLLFKNETHNHPTEIEPFGGAATCIGGAIRDPLSGRSYVYAAMRVTGAGDPRRPYAETLPGKLPQRRIVTTAAAGYSSYGNQIGLATGQVDELYHDGYVAKHLEIGAVIAATPAANVRRETPLPGDLVLLIGGRTGRDGCGGATGSSKSHTQASLETCGAEVQKGNAPEERKLQRLFRRADAMRLVKRCNDFGAGGISVAVGELADGLSIRLDAVLRKYDGLDGTELAISESQERMAVVVEADKAEEMIRFAREENLEATVIARVESSPRLVMHWNGSTVVDISREFLNSNGAEKHIRIRTAAPAPYAKVTTGSFSDRMTALAQDINVCSRRGLAERFDSTIGAGTVLMPFGGRFQRTPIQAMVHKISVEKGHTDDCSFMAWGFDPYISEKSPYHGAYLAVVESVSRLIAAGASFDEVYLTFQEYFARPGQDGKRWSAPLCALLGAYRAQTELGIAAIGGKDSMSGTFEHIDVPPTLVSFAVTTGRVDEVVSPEFKGTDHPVVLLSPIQNADGLPDAGSLREVFREVTRLMRKGLVLAAWTPSHGGIAEGLMKMSFGNGIGIRIDPEMPLDTLFGYAHGSFILELSGDEAVGRRIGVTSAVPSVTYGNEVIPVSRLLSLWERPLESVYPTHAAQDNKATVPLLSFSERGTASPSIRTPKPRVLIPVFPGTNCEYDTARALADAGAEPEIFVLRNLSPADVTGSVEAFAARAKQAQIIFIPGGFSAGDEPDGSGKFITAFFRNGAVKEQVNALLHVRGGLMCGICNGFQALIKLGLIPYGEIIDSRPDDPTLTFNTIRRHQSMLVRTRVASVLSPWLADTQVGDICTVPISHGEGRLVAPAETLTRLAARGQIATQYVDLTGQPTMDIAFNPNGSLMAIEGLTSPDGRVLGKMGHSERVGSGLYRNVEGRTDMGLFASAVRYFR